MSKIKYSREQLLSLSGLDVCSKLPSGFDPSILSEFEDGYNSIPERSRIPGSLSSQNFRRVEYGSSPPTRGDLGNSSRGIHGKWDTRSSGLNDRDADLESDSGRRYGNQSRRSWQNPEGDGLLGSGSFPKASGFASASATNVRGSGQYQLNRTNEPYHPPRPYKAAPHSRRDATDIINEETFGSSEGSSQDRAEEERKRRASFEQFRKEQKAFHEKQTQFPDKHNENADPDKAAALVDSEDDKKLWDKNLRLEDMAPSILQGNSAKCSVAAQTSASRPLVPPGFIGVVLEKNLGAKSIITQPTSEVGIVKFDENITQLEGNVEPSNNLVDEKLVSNVNTNEQKYEIRTIHTPLTDINEKPVILSSEGAIFGNSVHNVSPIITSSNLSEANGGRKNDEGTEFNAEKVPGHDAVGIASNEHSTSILEKLFGKASIVEGVSVFSEPGDVTANTEDHVPFRSSKFTHWFHEEEKNVQDDLTSGKPEDLLSLIVGGEKDGSQVPRVTEKIPSIYPQGSNNLIQKSGTSTSSTITSIEPPYQSSNSGGTQGVLTCEDLEQSILSECGGNGSNLEHSVQAWNDIDAKAERRPEVNNHASQHLLFLLQKGTSANDLAQLPNQEVSENSLAYDSQTHNASLGDGEKDTTSERNLTLETLFGTAFMKELQSVKAPVSVRRGSVGAVPPTDVLDSHGFPFSVSDDGFSPRSSTKSTLEGDIHVSNHLQQSKSNKNVEAWVGYDGPQRIVGPNVIGSIDRPGEELEIQLPEEDSLITLSDPVISQHSIVVPVGNASKADSLSSSSMPVDIVDKLAELNAVLKRERSGIPAGLDGQRFLHGLSSPVVPDSYLNQQEQPTSQFAYLQMNQGRSSFHPLDPHPSRTNHPIKVMGPENIHPEFSQHHASNMIHPSPFQHAPNGPTRFSPPAHHPMLQHMHMQSNLPPPHLLRGLPRGAPMPPFAVNHMSGYAPEPNPMQNFPYGHQQANYGGLELPIQAHGGTPGNNHPEALERLFEMELRANLKKMHPVTGAAHSLGNNGKWYRHGLQVRIVVDGEVGDSS